MKTQKLLLALAIVLLMLSACSGRQKPANTSDPANVEEPANEPVKEPEPAVEETAEPEPMAIEYPLTITDVTGHSITLESMPERIVIAGRATFMVQDAVYLFAEASERIAGIENRQQSVFTFLPVIDPNLDQKELFEANAGPEQIAAVTPDLVLLKNFMAEQLGDPLEILGIPVLYLDLETPDAFYQDIQTLGQLFANPARAEEIVAFYQSRAEQVESLAASVEKDPKPTVLILQYSAQGEEIAFEVPPDAWLQTMLVEIVGGEPIWKGTGEAGGWSIVSLDQIAAWDPDQIYLIEYDGAGNEIIAGLKEDPIWQEFTAVQNDQISAFPVDFYSWDQPDTRWILGLEWLLTQVHPELASEIGILEEVYSFYSVLYGMDSAAIEADVIPLLSDDLP